MNVDDTVYSQYHIPVLRDSSVTLLLNRPDGIYVDGTCGGGGHTVEILRHLRPDARVICLDQDDDAVAHCEKVLGRDGRVTVVKENFGNLRPVLKQMHISKVEGVLLDLGISSWQIDNADRGFSYRLDGLLDMRMNREKELNAMQIIESYTRDELANLLFAYGEEKQSFRIADAIIRERQRTKIETTSQLVEIVSRVIPERFRTKSLSRIFQALRIAVNNELETLKDALEEIPPLLNMEGRMVVISYHSLEDRIVKNFFKKESALCICPPKTPVCVCGKIQRMHILTRRPVTPDQTELSQNPRARSAKLRAAEKIGN